MNVESHDLLDEIAWQNTSRTQSRREQWKEELGRLDKEQESGDEEEEKAEKESPGPSKPLIRKRQSNSKSEPPQTFEQIGTAVILKGGYTKRSDLAIFPRKINMGDCPPRSTPQGLQNATDIWFFAGDRLSLLDWWIRLFGMMKRVHERPRTKRGKKKSARR